MAVSVTRTRKLNIAFALDKESLLSATELLKSVSERVDFRVQCSDGYSYSCSAPDEVLQISNTKPRQIESIALSSGWSDSPRVDIRFRAEKYLATVEYEIVGDGKEVAHLADKLDERLPALRQWYTRIAFVDFVIVFYSLILASIALFVVAASILLSVAPAQQEAGQKSAHVSAIHTMVAIIAAVASPIIAGVTVNRVRDWLFPRGMFLIGNGVERYKQLVFWRQFIGTSLILTIVAGIVASLVANWITSGR